MTKLKIWIIQTGESVPVDSFVTAGRSLSLSAVLARRGHSVTFWASTFDHALKRYIDDDKRPTSIDGINFIYLMGRPYQKNVSIARILNHREEARSFLGLASKMEQPDVIVCCLPTLDLAEAATELGKAWGVPVLIDIRDMWPKIFSTSIPQILQPLAPLVLKPFYRQLINASSNATGIVGVSRGLVDYALSYAGRQYGPQEAVFPLSSYNTRPSEEQLFKSSMFWDEKNIGTDGRLVACYTGTLTYRACGNLLNVAKIFNGSAELRERWKLIICGVGELEPELKAMSSESVELFGWVNQFEVAALLERATVGIIPYPSEPDFLTVCPNKFGTYLSAGLPILSHIDGEVGRLINEADCGWVYGGEEDLLNALALAGGDSAEQVARRIRAKLLFEREFNAESVYRAFSEHVEAAAIRAPL